MTTKVSARESKVANVVEIVRGDLRVDVRGAQKARTFLPTIKFSLDHVLGAELDPEIERKFWRSWVLVSANRVPAPGVKFYNPRLGNSHKAIVIWLKDEPYERLVVEVEEPTAVVAMINEVVEA